jgi:hypothetical protein
MQLYIVNHMLFALCASKLKLKYKINDVKEKIKTSRRFLTGLNLSIHAKKEPSKSAA